MACGPVPEALLLNRLDRPVTIDVYGPIESLSGGCEVDFRDRFCEEEFVPLSIIELQEAEQRVFTYRMRLLRVNAPTCFGCVYSL